MKRSKWRLILGSLIVLVMCLGTLPLASMPVAGASGVELSGILNVIRGDPECSSCGDGPSTRYLLTDDQGDTWRLEIDEAVISSAGGALALAGKRVKVVGDYDEATDTFLGHSIALSAGDSHAFAFSGPSVMGISGSVPWATLLCRFGDSTGSPPANLAYFEQLFGYDGDPDEEPEMNHYWLELSYNNVNIDGSEEYVAGWRVLPHPRSYYVYMVDPDGPGGDPPYLWADLGALAVDAANLYDDIVDFSQFKGINFIFDGNLDCCAWGGGVTLNNDGGPRNYCSTWMPPWGWQQQGVMAHEMGHGFGLPHSSGPYDATYDSQWDVMSDANNAGIDPDPVLGPVGVHTISYHKDLLGAIPASRKYTADTSNNQFVTLERLALPGSSGYLMVQIPVGSPGSGLEFYTIEARKFAGYDRRLGPGEAVVMHTVDTARDKPANVVDVDDNGNCNDAAAAWLPGELFEDTVNGISMAVVKETTSGYVIVINPTADVAISKIDYPDPVMAGNQLYYYITVTNYGPGPAVGTVVTDTLPAGVTFITDDLGICTEGPPGTLTCDCGSIVGGRSKTIAIKVEVDADLVADAGGPTSICNDVEVTNEVPDTDLSNNSATACTIVEDLADLRVMKDCKPDVGVLAGEAATCTIIVENLGPSTARDVTAVDTYLSDGTFEIGTVTTTQGTFVVTPNPQVGSGEVSCSLGDLAPGETATIVVPVSADEAQDINDHITVSSETSDPDPANNIAEDGVSVVPAADLQIVKTDIPDPVVAGTSLTYTLTVTNTGPSTAANVVVMDWLPADVIIDSLTPSAGSVIAGEPGDVSDPTIWTVGSLIAGQTETMIVGVTVLPQTAEGTLLHNDAEVCSATLDPDNSDNVVSADTTVTAEADLSIDKMDFPDPVVAGEQLKYEVSVTNNGPSTARDVLLTEELPAGVSFVSASISDGGTWEVLEVPPLTVKCSLNDLDPGESVVVYVTVLVDPSVLHGSLISNTATVSSSTEDPNVTNNVVTEDTTVNAKADLIISKDASVVTSNAGPRVIYTLTVVNSGPSDAQNVVVVDTLPLDPKKVIYVMDTGNGACTYSKTPPPHKVTWNIGTLKAGETRSVQIFVDIRGSVGVISNYATVTSSTFDPILTNNTVRKDVRIKGGPGKK